MEELFYLTDNIFIKDNKYCYEKKNNINVIKNHNWHHLLREYGWEKLDKYWIKHLNKLSGE